MRESVEAAHEDLVAAARRKVSFGVLTLGGDGGSNSRQDGQRAGGHRSKEVDAHATVESVVALGLHDLLKRLDNAGVTSVARGLLDLQPSAQHLVRIGRYARNHLGSRRAEEDGRGGDVGAISGACELQARVSVAVGGRKGRDNVR